jgi:hypothetical protein
MTKRTPRLLTVFAAALIVTGFQNAAAQDTGEIDTVFIDSATSFVSGIGVVPIHFFNDEPLDLIELTLKHVPTAVNIDSFSFAGGRVFDDVFSKEVLISADSTKVAIVAFTLSGPPIMPGTGLLGKLYYSYPQSITPQVIPITTTTWLDGPILHTNSFGAYDAASFVPVILPGYLDILAAPDTYDSVWVDEMEASPGEKVAIDVFGFNERNLAKLSVALYYGTADLTLDSVSFVGTRCAAAPSKTVQPQTSLFKVYSEVEFAPTSPLPPGTGTLMTLYFTIVAEATEGFIEIDSTTVGIVSNTRYWLTAADGGDYFQPFFRSGGIDVKTSTDVEDLTDPELLPTDYNLAQNYPNPFNPSTNIEFSLPESARVRIEVFNILGRKVRHLIDRELPAGTHRIEFDGRDARGHSLATGVYFYRLSTDSYTESKKMMLLK